MTHVGRYRGQILWSLWNELSDLEDLERVSRLVDRMRNKYWDIDAEERETWVLQHLLRVNDQRLPALSTGWSRRAKQRNRTFCKSSGGSMMLLSSMGFFSNIAGRMFMFNRSLMTSIATRYIPYHHNVWDNVPDECTLPLHRNQIGDQPHPEIEFLFINPSSNTLPRRISVTTSFTDQVPRMLITTESKVLS